VAGVAKTILVRVFNPLTQAGALPAAGDYPSGILPFVLTSFVEGNPDFLSLIPLVATVLVFIIVSFVQKIEVEIPMAFSLPFGKFAARRWPLKFLYTSNIPVILVSAVLANIQVMGRVLFERGITFLGTYNDQGVANPGSFMYYISTPSNELGITITVIIGSIFALFFVFLAIKVLKRSAFKMCILGAVIGLGVGVATIMLFNLPGITMDSLIHVLLYMGLYILGSTIFSIFWTATSGMDAKSVAEQFKSYFIMIPGFRHDPRIAENVLSRYIPVLTVLGGAFIGFIASYADLTSAIGTGTGLLLAVMIVYQLYEQIMQQHGDDMPEPIKKFLGE
jgi:preprotein translocase subunit SecY